MRLKSVFMHAKVTSEFCIFLLVCTLSSFGVDDGRLSFKLFNSADGLPSNRIQSVFQDRKGYLWISTWEGLSRFDGYTFTNYYTNDGLPNQLVNDVAEDGYGRLWVATNDNGIAMLDDTHTGLVVVAAKKKFVSYKVNDKYTANKVNSIHIDSTNNIWCATDDGLYVASMSDMKFSRLIRLTDERPNAPILNMIFEDERGAIWYATLDGLHEITDGKIVKHKLDVSIQDGMITGGLEDSKGRIILVSSTNEIFLFNRENDSWKSLGKSDSPLYGIIEVDDGTFILGGVDGLSFLDAAGIRKIRTDERIGKIIASALFKDHEGNVWAGTGTKGLIRMTDRSISSLFFRSGQTEEEISSETAALLPEITQPTKMPWLRGFMVSKSNSKFSMFYNTVQKLPIDHTVFRFSDGEEVDISRFFDSSQAGNELATFYYDSEGVLWYHHGGPKIYREAIGGPGKGKVTEVDYCGSGDGRNADVIADDGKGGVWIFARGSYNTRIRGGQCEKPFGDDRTNQLDVRSAFLDSRGWFWIGTRFSGVYFTRGPQDDLPVLEQLTVENGLRSPAVWSITEDDQGRMYFATGRGMSRYDPVHGIWNSFTTKEGLAGDNVTGLFRDEDGVILITTLTGVSRFDPRLEKRLPPPPRIYISRINVAGEDLWLPETGTANMPESVFDATQNNLTIDFVGLRFQDENNLKYQHILSGADAGSSKPDSNRTITYANLAAGEYHFLVWAVTEDGLKSETPAEFRFVILPPIYLRWWFLTALFLIAAASIYALYRFRLRQMIEIERTRTMIATDLHDDIGSNLSKISVLSDVARLSMGVKDKEQQKLLGSIADISRESITSMSDIVWAIDPKRDSLREMSVKMRSYAGGIFVPRGITVNFAEPVGSDDLKLPMERRREIYLIFKEAINNASKHSDATIIDIEFLIAKGWITLKVSDNGRGFHPTDENGGNGLENMTKRAANIKGEFKCTSAPGDGTIVECRFQN